MLLNYFTLKECDNLCFVGKSRNFKDDLTQFRQFLQMESLNKARLDLNSAGVHGKEVFYARDRLKMTSTGESVFSRQKRFFKLELRMASQLFSKRRRASLRSVPVCAATVKAFKTESIYSAFTILSVN